MENPPEEGDLNTQAIKKGLTPEEQKYLQKDLEAVESGRMSSDSLASIGDDTKIDFEQRSYEDDRQRERDEEEFIVEGMYKFKKSQGIPEEEIRYDDIYEYVQTGGTIRSFSDQFSNIDEEKKLNFIKRLEKLEEDWREATRIKK